MEVEATCQRLDSKWLRKEVPTEREGEEEAGRRQQPGSQEVAVLPVSWPGPAVAASPGLSFLRGWTGGLMEPFTGGGGRGAASAGGLLKLTLKPTKRGGGPTDHCILPTAPVLHRDDSRGFPGWI